MNVDHSYWYESIYENYRTDLKEDDGFLVKEFRFTGFWSQGDGASFNGSVVDAEKFLTTNFPALDIALKAYREIGVFGINLRFTQGNGCHQFCTSLSAETDLFPTEHEDPFMEANYAVWNERLDEQMSTLETGALEYLRGKMVDLYKDLESEYEHQVSDEAVWDWIENNLVEIDLECDNDCTGVSE